MELPWHSVNSTVSYAKAVGNFDQDWNTVEAAIVFFNIRIVKIDSDDEVDYVALIKGKGINMSRSVCFTRL